ncbi:MAG TPA: LysE family transporter [Gammaproteobacteria bacterium]|nr:LysE family transporter [Gammaproteobacteria bacterium]
MITKLVLDKIILGISLAAPIGPVSIEMIKRGLKGGFFSAFTIRLGGAMGNSLCLLGAYFGLSFLLNQPMLYNLIGFAGAGFLVYMGASSLLKKQTTINLEGSNQPILSNGLLVGLFLALANPIGVVFWFGIFAASMSANQTTTSFADLCFNGLIIVGVLLWGAFLSLLLEGGKRIFNNKIARVVTIVSSLLLLGYGFKYGFLTFQKLMGL